MKDKDKRCTHIQMIAKTIEPKRKGKLLAIELEIIVITGWLHSQCVSKNNVYLYLYRGPGILGQCLLKILLYVRIKCPTFRDFYLSDMTYGGI